MTQVIWVMTDIQLILKCDGSINQLKMTIETACGSTVGEEHYGIMTAIECGFYISGTYLTTRYGILQTEP